MTIAVLFTQENRKWAMTATFAVSARLSMGVQLLVSSQIPDLRGKVAVVTGASRGGGRAIALALGEAGATVYVTGRSVRGGTTTENLPETIDDTADEVTARGGVGIPV